MIEHIKARRLYVSGGSKLTPNTALLWGELGKLMAEEDGLVVITGGMKSRDDSPNTETSDYAFVKKYLRVLKDRGIDPDARLETFLPDENRDPRPLKRFREGHVRDFKNRTPQSRRFTMAYTSNVIISIEGEKGSRSVLDVALAIERPFLPLPIGGGAAADFWYDFREQICKDFQIPEKEADKLEKIHIGKLSKYRIKKLAAQIKKYINNGFTRNCFVIMPFRKEHDPVYDRAIKPALEDHGLNPIRTDRSMAAGNILEAIREGLRHCFFSIADTTGDNPNVMYELGMAHAHGKPVILLRKSGDDGELTTIPFDLQTERLIKYSDSLDELKSNLDAAISVLCGNIKSLDDRDKSP